MRTAARHDIWSWRNEARVYPIRVRGLDLTGVAMRAQLRQGPDTPGAPIADLTTVTSANAQGLRLLSVETVDGMPVSTIALQVNMTTHRDLIGYDGEIGSVTRIWWALSLAGKTRLQGVYGLLPHVLDSDQAPTERTGSVFGGAANSPIEAGATITIAGDEIVEIVLDGAGEMAVVLTQAEASENRARQAADAATAAEQRTNGTAFPDFVGPQEIVADAGGDVLSVTDDRGRLHAPMAIENLRHDDGSPLFTVDRDPSTPWLARLLIDPQGNVADRLLAFPEAVKALPAVAMFGAGLSAADFMVQEDGFSEESHSLSDRTLFISAVSAGVDTDYPNRAPLYCSRYGAGGGRSRSMFGRVLFATIDGDRGTDGQVQTDDHCAPAVLLDPRPGAPWPLLIFQADHNGAVIRLWRSATGRVEDLAFAYNVPVGAGANGSATYPSPFRNPNNPDEIWLFCRAGGNSSSGPWRLSRCNDNAAAAGSWTPSGVLWQSSGLYPKHALGTGRGVVESYFGGGGGTLAPIAKLALMRWDGAYASWTAGSGETIVSANIFAEPAPIDVLNDARVRTIYTGAAGHLVTDTKSYMMPNGMIFTTLVDFVRGREEATSRLVGLTLDPATGAVTTEDIAPAGGIYDRLRNDAQYFGEACFRETGLGVIARWSEMGNFGELVALRKLGTNWTETLLLRLPGRKIMRPRFEAMHRIDVTTGKPAAARGSRVTFMVGGGRNAGYTDLTTWATDVWTLDTRKVA